MTKDIKLTAGDYVIDQSDKIKILGIYYTSGLDNQPNINMIIQRVNYRISILGKIIKSTNKKTSLLLYNSLVISIFNYCIGCFLNNSVCQNSKLNTLLNKCTHKILGITSYSKTASTNLKRLNWLSYSQMLIMGGTKLFHKVILLHKPIDIAQYLRQSMIQTEMDSRFVRQSFLIRQSTTNRTYNSFFYRAIRIYNTLPNTIKGLEPKIFNKRIKEVIRNKYSPDKVP